MSQRSASRAVGRLSRRALARSSVAVSRSSACRGCSAAPARCSRAASRRRPACWPDRAPRPPGRELAYVTETASALAEGVARGGQRQRTRNCSGPGSSRCSSPNGQSVAVSLFGTAPDSRNTVRRSASTPRSALRSRTTSSLETATATPLAWSPDSRYLAVCAAVERGHEHRRGLGPGRDRHADGHGHLDRARRRSTARASRATAATGSCSRCAHSLSPSAPTNLYMSEADGAGLRRLTSDGRSLNPVWGPTYIAYDRERLRRNYAPTTRSGWRTPSGVARAQAHARPRRHARRRDSCRSRSPPSGSRLLAEFEGEDTSNA